MANEKSLIGAEFQALPLDYLIAAPLTAAIKAQRVAAETTKQFLESMIEDGKPTTVDFSVKKLSADGHENSIQVNAPLLSLVPVPHLRIDSLTIHFNFEISQTYRDSSTTDKSISTEVKSGKMLSPWVNASLKGSVSSKASKESTTNRSGQLDIMVQASESEIPEGLARVLSLMTSAIQTPDANKTSSKS
jgi:hypothetical protein